MSEKSIGLDKSFNQRTYFEIKKEINKILQTKKRSKTNHTPLIEMDCKSVCLCYNHV